MVRYAIRPAALLTLEIPNCHDNQEIIAEIMGMSIEDVLDLEAFTALLPSFSQLEHQAKLLDTVCSILPLGNWFIKSREHLTNELFSVDFYIERVGHLPTKEEWVPLTLITS